MSIKSDTFGRVTLTEGDAAKFRAQVTHGRPKAAAIANVKRGIKLSRSFQANGKLTVPASPAK